MLTKEKIAIRPLLYPEALEFWEKSASTPWWHKSIDMQQDQTDWYSNMSDEEKNVVGNILKGFAQTETLVSDYWVRVATWFPVSEIQRMAISFADREGLHGEAYNHLNSSLDINDYDGFMKEESIKERLESLMCITRDDYANFTKREIATSIAIFSAGCEGIQLFSSFSILLSFKNRHKHIYKLKGVSDQMEWSIQDENLHSIAGCWLFRQLCAENEGLKEVVESNVIEGLKLAVELEENYLNKIFEKGDIPSIGKDEVLNFLYYRANMKFKELGYEKELFRVDDELLKQMAWFEEIITSNKDNDFFNSHSSNYSKATGDWSF